MIIKFKRPDVTDAIKSLVTGVAYSVNSDTNEITHWDINNVGITQPTDEAISTALTQLEAEYDAQEYARKRLVEYPAIEELIVALYDTDDKSAIETKRAEIKLKYPK